MACLRYYRSIRAIILKKITEFLYYICNQATRATNSHGTAATFPWINRPEREIEFKRQLLIAQFYIINFYYRL
jgi:hypothetical protein